MADSEETVSKAAEETVQAVTNEEDENTTQESSDISNVETGDVAETGDDAKTGDDSATVEESMETTTDDVNPSIENKKPDTSVEEKSQVLEAASDEIIDVTDANVEDSFGDNDEMMGDDDQMDEIKDAEVELSKEDGGEDEEDEEEDEEYDEGAAAADPNVMPQVNVTVLAKRKWQVKVYPLKPADFASGQISRVFKHSRESLLYLLSPGRFARGKGEMYISSMNMSTRVVYSLMKLNYHFPEINIEVIKKNDEGAVEEKAYLRFDSHMTSLLCLPMTPFRNTTHSGRKRERLIGSIFVKNLPPGTTKDMLRVMFPFAQEINYNPEKFKDCTARLVLKSRDHVIPCLKAFAKIELGGNVLELHPLEKKKRPRTLDDSDAPDAKHRKKSEEEKKTDAPAGEDTASGKPAAETKVAPTKDNAKKENVKAEVKKETKTPEAKAKKDVKPSSKSGQQQRASNVKGTQQPQKRSDFKRPFNNRPKTAGGQEMRNRGNNYRGPGFRSPGAQNRQDRPGIKQDRTGKGSLSSRGYQNQEQNRGNRNQGNRSQSNRNLNRSMGGSGNRGSLGRVNRNFQNRSMGTAFSANKPDLGINTEATKEMVILQSQLSMAIKNQIAMLNQTQIAVEQAKRGASSLSLSSDVHQAGPSASKGGYEGSRSVYGKRVTDPYGSVPKETTYGNRNRVRARKSSFGGGGSGMQGGGYGKRAAPVAAMRDHYEDDYYDKAHEEDLALQNQQLLHGRYRDMGYGHSSRSVQGAQFGNTARSPAYGGLGDDYANYRY